MSEINQDYYIKNDNFISIVRIRNTNVDGKRKLAFGLSQIYGIGRRIGRAIVLVSGLDPEMRVGLLTEEQVEKLEEIIKEPTKYGIPTWMVNRQKDLRTGEYLHITGSELIMRTKRDVETMKKIRSWKGIRHMYGLKVRGQRTRSTGRHGLVVGFMRKEQRQQKK